MFLAFLFLVQLPWIALLDPVLEAPGARTEAAHAFVFRAHLALTVVLVIMAAVAELASRAAARQRVKGRVPFIPPP